MTSVPRPENWVPVLEEAGFTRRRLRLVCVGAGFSGLILAHKIKHVIPEAERNLIDLQIYEKNPDLGGTWYENRYPGAACDIPSHAYQFPFESSPNWSSFYSGSEEIWQYMKDTAVKYGLEEFIQVDSEVIESIWDDDKAKWRLKIQQKQGIIEDECDILINGSGPLNKWKWPEIKGLHNFKGKLLHTARWDPSYDWSGKKVALIGNGSSAIQVLPEIQPAAKEVVTYMRNPTWITQPLLGERSRNGKNFQYTEEEKRRFRKDPSLLFEMRKELEQTINGYHMALIEGTPKEKAWFETSKNLMIERLNGNERLIQQLVPNFKVGCRRLTPGEGYLEALQEDNVRICWDPIVQFTEGGIETEVGEEEFDLIICATGFDVSFRPSWKILGRDGCDLHELWKTEPAAYFGLCAVGHPNYFIYVGPNTPLAHGILTQAMDVMTDYILKWCTKIATEDIKSITIKPGAVDDLSIYSQEVLKRTVWAGGCRSWYKNYKTNGTVTALHGGSALHYRECIKDIRGEDFDIEYWSANRFRFLGNGLTQRDVRGEDLTYYLH